MKVIIVGCGRVGSRLALRLVSQNHDVVVIDEVREAFTRLGANYSGPLVQGSGMDTQVLRRAQTQMPMS